MTGRSVGRPFEALPLLLLLLLPARPAAAEEAPCPEPEPVCTEQPPPWRRTCRAAEPPGAAFAVSDEAPAAVFEASGTRTSSRFTGDFLDALPIHGHDWQDALVLAPGVTDPDGDGIPNVHGARESASQYRLDGADVTDPEDAGAAVNLNPLVVESLEVITAGAPAGYGRASGGFVNVTTRSGGNDLAARLSVYWRGRALDGDGADNQDAVSFDPESVPWRDIRAAASVGGPFVKDHLWYFAAVERLDATEPADRLGTGLRLESEGTYHFGKVTWQAGATHRLAVQTAADPRRTEGLGLTALTSEDSGYDLDQRSVSTKLGWTATLSPSLLLEAAFTRLDHDIDVEPTSSLFEPISIQLVFSPSPSGANVAALYPCSVVNCSEALGEKRIYQIDELSGRVGGPFFFKSADRHERNAVRADLSWLVEAGIGTHALRAGFELADEESRRESLRNPILFDATTPVFSPGPPTNQVTGVQILQTSQPGRDETKVSGFSSGIHLADAWKPRANLMISAGLRFDREQLDAPGYEPFDPGAERRRSVKLWRAVCAEAARQGVAPSFSNCSPTRLYNGSLPVNIGPIASFLDQDMDGVNDVPAEVAALDLDQDGYFRTVGVEGLALLRYFTTFEDRVPVNYETRSSQLSPRLGISWDPWADGRTRLFAHWGRYHERLLAEWVRPDSEPTLFSFTFLPHPFTRVIAPGQISSFTTLPSLGQSDHDLRSARTDELSLGVEREFGSAWSAGLTWIRRKAYGLPQDTDLNHYTCDQTKEAMGVSPVAVCGDAQGRLVKDRFGTLVSFGQVSGPNGVEDLYAASGSFNQVLRVGNTNSSDYAALELKITRRLHRNWQMQASYTWSRARGQAESFLSALGDDPSTTRLEAGYLDYDQRHRIAAEAAAFFSHGITLGGRVTWASGTPYSVVRTVLGDVDSSFNINTRTLYPEGGRNDQRNEGTWLIDARIEKSFTIARVEASGFLSVENLTGADNLEVSAVDRSSPVISASRDFGRRFEVGATIGFR